MELVDLPGTLECAECGEAIQAAGYLPAVEGPDGYAPATDAAVCDACGFNEIGMAGCAPELDEVDGGDAVDALLYVRIGDAGVEVASVKH